MIVRSKAKAEEIQPCVKPEGQDTWEKVSRTGGPKGEEMGVS